MSPNAKAEDLIVKLAEATRDSEAATTPTEGGSLDDRTRVLVVIAAAVCTDSSTHTFTSLVTSAREAGVTEEEILGVLLTIGPAVGESRVVGVTPRISKALGYDVERAMEYG